jgi:hypothetical protein
MCLWTSPNQNWSVKDFKRNLNELLKSANKDYCTSFFIPQEIKFKKIEYNQKIIRILTVSDNVEMSSTSTSFRV